MCGEQQRDEHTSLLLELLFVSAVTQPELTEVLLDSAQGQASERGIRSSDRWRERPLCCENRWLI